MTQTLDLDHNISTTLLTSYASMMNSTVQENDSVYNLRNFIYHVQHRDRSTLMGDFNDRVGNDHEVLVLFWVIIVVDA